MGRTRSEGGRVRYSALAREAALEHVARRRSEGASLVAAVSETGVPYQTMRGWLRGTAGGLRPVKVHAEPAPEREWTLLLPGGATIAALRLEDVADLLRQLR